MPKAAGLAAAIKKAHGVESKLIEGSGGVFDVHVDGQQVWSKQDVGRFPEDKEILDKIKPTPAKTK
ncbi:MAG: Rdx family protein [Phycisphaerales bacterium]|nr:Rdx family protein [Phycisphaerales bacterium]